MTQQPDTRTLERIECPASKDPVVRKLIIAALFGGMGIWCFYEAYVLRKYPYGSDINALGNWAMNRVLGPFLLLPVGLFHLGWAIYMLRRVFVADQEGLGYVGGEKTAWDAITSIDASRLDKGWLYLHTADGRVVLDGFKLKNFKALVAFIEDRVPAEKIRR